MSERKLHPKGRNFTWNLGHTGNYRLSDRHLNRVTGEHSGLEEKRVMEPYLSHDLDVTMLSITVTGRE